MSINGVGQTDVGKKRQNNEDAFHVDNERSLYIASDGMGGHKGGEVASHLAVETIERTLSSDAIAAAHSNGALDGVRESVAQAIRDANDAILDRAESDSGLSDMGCALSMVVFVNGQAVVGHIGDTRVYRLRDGVVDQLTDDHTFVGELVRAGSVPASEMQTHPHANVLTRALGSRRECEVDTLVVEARRGDRFLLCSDGLTAYVDDPVEIEKELRVEDYGSVPASLIDRANSSGGKDNVTVVVVDVS